MPSANVCVFVLVCRNCLRIQKSRSFVTFAVGVHVDRTFLTLCDVKKPIPVAVWPTT